MAVKIDRWLTPQDIEQHGDKWEWWAIGWGDSVDQSPVNFVASVENGDVVLTDTDGDKWHEALFDLGDYFTPIKGDGNAQD